VSDWINKQCFFTEMCGDNCFVIKAYFEIVGECILCSINLFNSFDIEWQRMNLWEQGSNVCFSFSDWYLHVFVLICSVFYKKNTFMSQSARVFFLVLTVDSLACVIGGTTYVLFYEHHLWQVRLSKHDSHLLACGVIHI
jgi:hypothetical protein